jgi:putative membrane protein
MEFIIAIVCGVGCGIITGLIPGIHINLISALLLSVSGTVLNVVPPRVVAVFIISMAVIHTFLDTIPSIFLGAPDAATALGVLPGHRMLLEGKGVDAVRLTVIGSYGSMIGVILLAPLLIIIMKPLQIVLQPVIGWLLVLVVLWMVWHEKKKMMALFLFLFSGSLGLVVLSMNLKQPLFPLLSGMFGISTLVMSLNENMSIPEQRIGDSVGEIRELGGAVGIASVIGSCAGFFPGLGPAQSAAIGAQFVSEGKKNFLVLVGGLSTANMISSIVTFFTLGKARNGAIIAVQELINTITLSELIVFMLVAFVVGGIGVCLALFFARQFALWIQRVPYFWICIAIIGLILMMVPIISGIVGLIVIAVSTCVGMIAPLVNVSRSHAMGCLLVPVILFFLL